MESKNKFKNLKNILLNRSALDKKKRVPLDEIKLYERWLSDGKNGMKSYSKGEKLGRYITLYPSAWTIKGVSL